MKLRPPSLLVVLGLATFGAACSRSGLPMTKRCGNGFRDPLEECDDGNRIDHDACSNSCKLRECGNGIVEPGEECDLGANNADRPAIELLHVGLPAGRQPVMPVDRPQDVVSFYDYTSESSHTGFEEIDLRALFLFRDTPPEVLSLVNHHGIDEDSSGVRLEHGLVDLEHVGVPLGTRIAIADETQEMFFEAEDHVVGAFEFWRNTDGGAITDLPLPGDWQIDSTVELHIGIHQWAYFDEEGNRITLDDAEVASLRAHPSPSECRTDCMLPRCGDGFVDGGEVCDDGNQVGNDGCAADCLSLND